MPAVITQLKKLLTGKKLYPKTIERAIYDDKGVRLDSKLSSLSRNGVVASANADYAEIGIWADENINNEPRLCKFVTLDDSVNGETISVATSTSDIVGVTVQSPAFSANASNEKFDIDGNLLPRYAYVCLMGLAKVADNGTCTVKGRCMPDDNGDAVPSSNNMGYQVISRVDSNTIIIAVAPNAEMLQRIRTDISFLENNSFGAYEDEEETEEVVRDADTLCGFGVDEFVRAKTQNGVIATLIKDNWVEENGEFKYTVNYLGLENNKTINMDLYCNETPSDDILSTYESIYDIEVNDEQIILTSSEQPIVTIGVIFYGKITVDNSVVINFDEVIDKVNELEDKINNLHSWYLIDNISHSSSNNVLSFPIDISNYKKIRLQMFLTDKVDTLQTITLYNISTLNMHSYFSTFSNFDQLYSCCVRADFENNRIYLSDVHVQSNSSPNAIRNFVIKGVYGSYSD